MNETTESSPAVRYCYICAESDGGMDGRQIIWATDADAAAAQYLDGCYPAEATTQHLSVDVREILEDEDEHAVLAMHRQDDDGPWRSVVVTIDPIEPPCGHADGHDWQSPHEIVGGIEENPGVWGHGGGVIITKCCMRCGCARITDTWVECDGHQGLTAVSYDEGRFAAELEVQTATITVVECYETEEPDVRDDHEGETYTVRHVVMNVECDGETTFAEALLVHDEINGGMQYLGDSIDCWLRLDYSGDLAPLIKQAIIRRIGGGTVGQRVEVQQ